MREKGGPIDIEKNPPATKVWRWMAKIILALQGCRNWNDKKSVNDYVRLRLGRSSGASFLTELSPVPAKGVRDKSWMQWFKSQDHDLDQKLKQRKTKLQEKLSENRSSLIICYGRGSADEFADLLDAKWQPLSSTMSSCCDRRCWLLPFFGNGRMSEAIVAEFNAATAAASPAPRLSR